MPFLGLKVNDHKKIHSSYLQLKVCLQSEVCHLYVLPRLQ